MRSSGNEARNAEIIRRRKNSEWPVDIAAELGVTKNTVIGVCNRAGLTDFNIGKTMQRPALGEASGNAKLKATDVLAIRNRYIPRCPQNGRNALAAEFGIGGNQVWQIVRGEHWRHLPSAKLNPGDSPRDDPNSDSGG